jgi:Family of unknown function (DUF6516)
MLAFFEKNEDLFASWFVLRYEREGDSYLLQIGAVLHDGSRLELRDYLFADGSRKYAYQWMEPDGVLRQRWDNAPHWPELATKPHHTHLPDQEIPEPSTVTNIEDLLAYLRTWLN